MESAQTNLNKTGDLDFIIRLLESGHNKTLKDQLVNWVGDKQEKFDLLFNVVFTRDYRLVQRASWPLSYIVQNHPSLIKKHFPVIARALGDQNLTDAVKRNLLRCLQTVAIPKKYCGRITDACFKFISDPVEKAAVKAFSISILDELTKTIPELRGELILMLESVYDHESPAFRARARKILKS
jgi:hypothetical protein